MGFHVRSQLDPKLLEAVQHCLSISVHYIQVNNQCWSTKVFGELSRVHDAKTNTLNTIKHIDMKETVLHCADAVT